MDLKEFQERILTHGKRIDLKPTERQADDGAFLIQAGGLYRETLTQLNFIMKKHPGDTDVYLAIPNKNGENGETSVLSIGKVLLDMEFFKLVSKLLAVFNAEFFKVKVVDGELKTTVFDPYTLITSAKFLTEKDQDAYF